MLVTNNNADNTTFEALYAQLQGVVTRLEQGDLPLDESLRLYEQGVKLASACQELLDGAELRIRQLQSGAMEDQ